jgi:LPS-assembly protein
VGPTKFFFVKDSHTYGSTKVPAGCFLTTSLLLVLLGASYQSASAQVAVPAGRGVAQLEARQQRREGNVYYFDGDVDLRFENMRLRADHVQYNEKTGDASARGNVKFDADVQHVEADEAHYNFQTGRGTFREVRGSIQAQRRTNPNVLLSPNPLTFEAQQVERLDEQTILVHRAWMTVCEPEKPLWKFYASRATIRIQRRVEMVNANFRFFYVPVIYMPYATVPLGRRLRQSGFLVPHVANTSRKGFVIGDSFYWAPVEWADLTVGAEYLSRRGWSQIAEMRVRPWENVRLDANYFGVVDRGLPGPGGMRLPQGGHRAQVQLDAQLPGGWRAAADLNTLTSLKFRLAFAETFAEAVNSEVHKSAFVTNNFRGFSINFALQDYKNFLSAAPETAVVLRAAPGVQFSSMEQAPWKKLPIYFGFDAAADAMHRSDPGLLTPAAVQRTEIAPRVTVPLRWGPWLGATTTAAVRTTRYGSQVLAGTVVGDSVRRTTGELTLDLRPPSFERVWERSDEKWKHTVEPELTYRYVTGVNDFGRFIRFDESDTLTDTNEVEYSITQRFYRRDTGGKAEELVSWKLAQKHYFDPTFGGALVPGQRNVFEALNTLSAFAFADGPRHFSPILSDIRVTPGGRYDAQFRVDYDAERGKLTTLGTLLNLRPYRESFITLAHFATQANNTLQPRSNQIRALVGWGELNRRGLNWSFAFSYDVKQQFFQNQVVQLSWNGGCCGIALEFRRLALGPLRSENQFRVALLIANIGTFGNLRRAEKIF